MENNETIKPSPKYWMSLEQWRHDPEFQKLVDQEFMSSPLQSGEGSEGWARREFLKLMGASIALTSFGCVRRPAQKIIPYVTKPEEITHGIANYYASAAVDGLEGIGILVTTRDGRPIKIEGNPDHPTNEGGMSARAHAQILKLYDPDRVTEAKRNLQNERRTNRETIGVSWESLDQAVVAQLQKGKVALLMASHLSPSMNALVNDFTNAFGAKVYRYDDLSYDTFQEAQRLSYGAGAWPRYRMDQARLILSVNNDFLGTWMTPVAFNRQFSKGRKADAEMNQLIVLESLLSLTGTNADERHRIRPQQTLDVLVAILRNLVVEKKLSRFASDANVTRALSAYPASSKWSFDVGALADKLWEKRGQSLVMAGDSNSEAAVYVAANLLNAVLENDGKTVMPAGGTAPYGGSDGIGALLQAIQAKSVNTLIIHGCNPGYSLPASTQFLSALVGVGMVIYSGDRNDETARYADYLAADHHNLEKWGDMLTPDGVYAIQQPTIEALHKTRAFEDSLLSWMKGANKGSSRVKASESWYDYVRSYWRESVAKGRTSDEAWNELLQKGMVSGSPGGGVGGSRGFQTSALSALSGASTAAKSGFEMVLYPTVGLSDGTLANVSWLQEFPDPVTKIVWDNYACFSPKDAQTLKIKEGQFVELTVNNSKVSVPAHIQPGQADGVVGLALGYGRTGAGHVADGVGVNAYQLAGWKNGRRLLAGMDVQVAVQSKKIELACTQGHHSMEGRQIVVEETLADHIKKPGGRVHRHNITTMWSEHKYNGNKWGMTIDLNTCTGCSACVIACQSENNIPTVGKKYVIQGREMHWIRIDRYYVGQPEDPSVVHQPLLCMHCDNAPCETVCPVIATVHSDEGTNDMIYNRCVGTRYCSNNCPYKVRRFNWFNYTNNIPEPKRLALNPEVTVRFRGVMEKCTFCIHRIRSTKAHAKLEDRKLRTNEVQVACAQSCPTKAITFGDLNDPQSDIAKVFQAPSSYALLEELNTKPAVRYHVKVRNTETLKGGSHHHEEAGGHA